MNAQDQKFMHRAIELAEVGMNSNSGGPFGCVIVKDNVIIAEGHNEVTSTNDPSAHAEIVAIRKACKKLNSFQLEGCTIYTSCEPCPMCLGAIYWARPEKVFYACEKRDAAQINFDDEFIYKEIEKELEFRKLDFEQVGRSEGLSLFKKWMDKSDKIQY